MTDPTIDMPGRGATPGWHVYEGWAAPVWTDPSGAVVHLFDLAHGRVDEDVRRRAVDALRKLIHPSDLGGYRLPGETIGDG